MFDEQSYIKKQEELYQQYILEVDINNKKRIAEEISREYINKEIDTEKNLIDSSEVLGDGSSYKVQHIPEDRVIQGAIGYIGRISYEKVTVENMHRTLAFSDAETGEKINFASILEGMSLEDKQKLCDAINLLSEQQAKNIAEKSGFDLKTNEKDGRISHEFHQKDFLKDVDIDTLDKQVQLIQEDVQSMKTNSMENMPIPLTPIPDSGSLSDMPLTSLEKSPEIEKDSYSMSNGPKI